eukprot:TRINITY_DN9159_c0_g1_i2.p1 TRINITY_DN9159_c0_g1~~TRINITY_DN9159_c0_g1_i2.p1  ORF type:complete len:540 (+),score=74.19 TRINITY_DN9159_c0_g1_i2:329-1948(+)
MSSLAPSPTNASPPFATGMTPALSTPALSSSASEQPSQVALVSSVSPPNPASPSNFLKSILSETIRNSAESKEVGATMKRKKTIEKHNKKLQQGGSLIKKCRGNRYHVRWVNVSPDMSELRWGRSRDQLESLSNPQFKFVKSNTILKVYREPKISDRAFCVVTPNRKLVFQATSEKQRDEWVSALNWLVSQNSSVGAPSNVVHVTHVDRNFQWTGKNLQETFKLVEKLGEGSFGVVYRAIHNEAKMEVAVKFVKFSSSDADAAKSLRKEIAILRACSNENIVEYMGCWGPDQKKRLWIITEFCHLGSITDCLGVAKVSLTEAQIACIIASLLRGLVYLHNRKIVHRDIKARNILLTKEGVVKLADFGLAKDLEANASQSTNVVGSPLHMAPEVIRGGGPNYKSDIWSTGITAIELAEGKPPHWEKNAYQVMAIIPNADAPKLQSDQWSKEFQDFIAQCCIKDPNARPSGVSLLKHPFVNNVVSNEALNSLVEAYYANKVDKEDKEKQTPTIPEYQDNSEAKIVKPGEEGDEKKSQCEQV